MKYRKKPVVIEAMKFTGTEKNWNEICDWAGQIFHANMSSIGEIHDLTIQTLEGDHRADHGDYIIRGVAGEFYPCKPDIFAATYDLA